MLLQHVRVLFVVAGCLLVSLSSATAAEKPVELPIKRVVMFSSGVAFFEHQGEVDVWRRHL